MVCVKMTEEIIKIVIPFQTPSVNHLWGQRGFRKFLTKEAKELKEKIYLLVPNCKFGKNTKLAVNMDVYEDWFTKKNEIKKKDLDNKSKFVLDSIFEKLGVDDKQIFELTMKKIFEEDFNKYKTIITIKEIK